MARARTYDAPLSDSFSSRLLKSDITMRLRDASKAWQWVEFSTQGRSAVFAVPVRLAPFLMEDVFRAVLGEDRSEFADGGEELLSDDPADDGWNMSIRNTWALWELFGRGSTALQDWTQAAKHRR